MYKVQIRCTTKTFFNDDDDEDVKHIYILFPACIFKEKLDPDTNQ